MITSHGKESQMQEKPIYDPQYYQGSGLLTDRIAIVTGGDSGIGRAISLLFAREGANVAIIYNQSDQDAHKTKEIIEKEGAQALTITGDVSDPDFCKQAVGQVTDTWGKLNILVNNAGVQFPETDFTDITPEQLQRTFQVNFFGYFHMAQAALPHLHEHDSIINTTSVTAYRGSPHLIDYSATKGAIVAFTRSLAANLAPDQIRVNGVAPGPIWTPLITSTFPPKKIKDFGKDTLLGRKGQPAEVAPCYVFLASQQASYITGEILHPNGGDFISS